MLRCSVVCVIAAVLQRDPTLQALSTEHSTPIYMHTERYVHVHAIISAAVEEWAWVA
jgi:hypothetical protein